jgi:hypothetical protein
MEHNDNPKKSSSGAERPHSGIYSLNNRIIELENIIKGLKACSDPSDDDFLEILRTNQKRKKKKKQDDLQKYYNHYEKGLRKQLESKNFMPIHGGLILIIHYSIVYIEQNISKFAKTLDSEIDCNFKLDTCIDLINKIPEISEVNLPSEFYVETINHMCGLIYPKKPEITQIEELNTPPECVTEIPEGSHAKNLKRRKSIIAINFNKKNLNCQ